MHIQLRPLRAVALLALSPGLAAAAPAPSPAAAAH